MNKRLLELKQELEKDVTLERMAEIEKEIETIKAEEDSEVRKMKLLDELKAEERKRTPAGDPIIVESGRSLSEEEIHRNAFVKRFQGKTLSDTEKRVLITSESIVPTIIMDEIIDNLDKEYPLINAVGVTNVPDYLRVPIWDDSDAVVVAENGNITEGGDDVTHLDLLAYTLVKKLTITEQLKTLSISAVQRYIVSNLAANIGKLEAKLMVNGTGSSQPTGLAKAGSGANGAYVASDSVTIAAATDIKVADVLKFLAMVKKNDAKVTMNRSTWYTYFLPLQDDAKNTIISGNFDKWFLGGREVVFEDSVALGTAYLFSPAYFKANRSKAFAVKSQEIDLKTQHIGYDMFDCKPATGLSGFAKFTKAQS